MNMTYCEDILIVRSIRLSKHGCINDSQQSSVCIYFRIYHHKIVLYCFINRAMDSATVAKVGTTVITGIATGMIDPVRDGAGNYLWPGDRATREKFLSQLMKIDMQVLILQNKEFKAARSGLKEFFDYTGTEGVVPAYENLKDILKKVVANSEQAIHAVRTDVDKLEAMKMKILAQYFCDGYFSYEKCDDPWKHAKRHSQLLLKTLIFEDEDEIVNNAFGRSAKKQNFHLLREKGDAQIMKAVFSASAMVLDLEPRSLNEQSHPALPHTPNIPALEATLQLILDLDPSVEKDRKQYNDAAVLLVLELILKSDDERPMRKLKFKEFEQAVRRVLLLGASRDVMDAIYAAYCPYATWYGPSGMYPLTLQSYYIQFLTMKRQVVNTASMFWPVVPGSLIPESVLRKAEMFHRISNAPFCIDRPENENEDENDNEDEDEEDEESEEDEEDEDEDEEDEESEYGR